MPPHHDPTPDPGLRPGHIPTLDGLRGVAILLVLARHLVLPPRGSAPDLLHGVAQLGWIGVDLFFVLSGFLITGILYDSKGDEGYFRVFYARRALRIFPLYYGFLALYLALIPVILPQQAVWYRVLWENQAWLWLYANNLLVAVKGIHLDFGLSHFWSLAVEEQFYMIWPPLVFLLGRRSLLRLCLGMIVGAELLRVACWAGGVSPHAVYGLLPTRLDGLAVGAAIALLARRPGGVSALLPAARGAVAAGALALAATVWLTGGLEEMSAEMQLAGYAVLALFFGGVVVLCVAARPGSALERALAPRPLHFLGRHSYAVYVLHLPVLHLLLSHRVNGRWMEQALGVSPLLGRVAFFLLAVLLAVALSLVTWHLLEKPMLRLKGRFAYRPAPASPAGAASLPRAA